MRFLHCLLLIYSTVALNITYNNRGNDWPGLCLTGKLQSPIVIVDSECRQISNDSIDAISLIPRFRNAEVTASVNPFAYVVVSELGNLIVSIRSTNIPLQALSLHFHGPSEYVINGKSFDLEMHIVMNNPNIKNSLFVLSILFNRGNVDNRFISDVIKAQDSATLIDFSDLFGNIHKIENFYQFEGSLTTPPCTEGVKWHIWSEVQSLSLNQLEFFTNRWQNNKGFANGNGNNRALQDKNGRIIIKYS